MALCCQICRGSGKIRDAGGLTECWFCDGKKVGGLIIDLGPSNPQPQPAQKVADK